MTLQAWRDKCIAWTAIAVLTVLTPAPQAHAGVDKVAEGLVFGAHDEHSLDPSVEPWRLLSPEWPRETSVGVRRGDMDIHFGNDLAGPGIASYRFNVLAGGSRDDRALGIVALPSGGSFVVGRAGVLTAGSRTGTRLGIMRLRPDGRPDSRFGPTGNGRQVLDVLPSFDNRELNLQSAQGLVVDLGPLGGIVRFYLAGPYHYRDAADGDVDFAVVCMAIASIGPNQGLFEPCPNFGSQGLVIVNFDDGDGFRRDIPEALYLDTRGTTNNWRVLMAGRADRNEGGSVNVDMAVTRMNLFTGAPDTSFNSNGKVKIGVDLITHGGDGAYSLLVKPTNGKILVGGDASTSASSNRSVLLQLLPDGSLDFFGFCVPGNTDCDSPAELRNGRRGWNDDPTGNFSLSRVAALAFVQDLALPAPAFVVRSRGTQTTRAGAVSRVYESGGCGGNLCGTAVLDGFDRVTPVAVTADDAGVVVATYGQITGNPLSNTHVFRVDMQGVVTLDQTFTSIAPFPRQDWHIATSDASTPISRPSAIVRDRKGRYLIAGWHRNALAQDDNDFLIARLQNDVLFEHSFDYGGPP